MGLHQHLHEIIYLMNAFMIIGVVASSINGALRAVDAVMDITGAILLAFVAANAGGTIRDLLLGAKVFWMKDQFYIWLTFIVGAITFICIYYRGGRLTHKMLRKLLLITDAMGLAAFSMAGVEQAVVYAQSDLVVVLMGVWTAVGGGIIADVISNRIPQVFLQELYITIALIASVCYVFLYGYMDHVIASMISAIIIIVLRLCSIKYKLRYPVIKL